MPYTTTTTRRIYYYQEAEPAKMCFGAEPSSGRKYYYHTEQHVPVRQHHGHRHGHGHGYHQHQHHSHPRASTPARVSYPRVSTSSQRRVVPVVYGQTGR